MKKKFFIRIIFIFLLLAAGGNVYAQSNKVIMVSISASIPSTMATVVNEQNLNLGLLSPGVTETIQPDQPNSARVKLTGTPGAEIFLVFSLPRFLEAEDDSISISFSRTSVSVSETLTPSTNSKIGDPNVGIGARFGNGTNGVAGELYVSLGCTVSPSESQQPGDYFGDIIVTIIYTGN